jgi:hypothetical protein
VEKAEISSWHFIDGESRNIFLTFYWWRKQKYLPDILLVEKAEIPSWHFIGGESRNIFLTFYWWRKQKYLPGILLSL